MEKGGVLWDGTLNFEAEKRYVYDHDSKALYNIIITGDFNGVFLISGK